MIDLTEKKAGEMNPGPVLVKCADGFMGITDRGTAAYTLKKIGRKQMGGAQILSRLRP